MRTEFPAKLAFLLASHKHEGPCFEGCGRYKVPYGGRGGLKSYAAADAALIRGVQQFERVLCAREDMNSIAESVHHLLETRIQALGLGRHYQVEKARIIGPKFGDQQTEFIFAGLRHNVANIKSLEGATILWVEEAQNVSDDSWQTVIPTIRWEEKVEFRKSEIWVTFNPRLATDATYKRFILEPPVGAIVCQTSYEDNPWFPDVMRAEMETMRERNHAAYRHVYLGECVSEVEGAIFADQLKQARESGRITDVGVDRSKPVYTFWDLGYGDATAIWFAQAVGGWFQVVDYYENSGKTIADYVVALNHKGYMYGAHWLPWDCIDMQTHRNLAGGDRTRSVEQLMREACGSVPVRVASKMAVVDRINAARTIFSLCRFDADKCRDGIQALSHYQWAPMSASGAMPKTELHNWASHGSSAFCNLAVSIRQPVVALVRKPKRAPVGAWA